MIKPGTLCYVLADDWVTAEPGTEQNRGAIVEVVDNPHTMVCGCIRRCGALLYHVRAQDRSEYWVDTRALRPISDPDADADVSEWAGGKHPAEVTA